MAAALALTAIAPSALETVASAFVLAPYGSAASQEVFRTNVAAVRLEVSLSPKGVLPEGLRGDDFVIIDNGKVQKGEVIGRDSVDVDVVLVLDTSGSLAGARQSVLLNACNQVFETLRPSDRVGVVLFDSAVTIRSMLTSEHETVRAALRRVVRSGGGSAVRDAVFVGSHLNYRRDTRLVLVVLSDGVDNISWMSMDDVLHSLGRTTAVLHAIVPTATAGTFETRVDAEQLGNMAMLTGGSLWRVKSDQSVSNALAEVFRETRSSYTLAYYPDDLAAGWHRVEVRLKRSSAKVRARAGYWA